MWPKLMKRVQGVGAQHGRDVRLLEPARARAGPDRLHRPARPQAVHRRGAGGRARRGVAGRAVHLCRDELRRVPAVAPRPAGRRAADLERAGAGGGGAVAAHADNPPRRLLRRRRRADRRGAIRERVRQRRRDPRHRRPAAPRLALRARPRHGPEGPAHLLRRDEPRLRAARRHDLHDQRHVRPPEVAGGEAGGSRTSRSCGPSTGRVGTTPGTSRVTAARRPASPTP